MVDLTMNMNLSYCDRTATHFAVWIGLLKNQRVLSTHLKVLFLRLLNTTSLAGYMRALSSAPLSLWAVRPILCSQSSYSDWSQLVAEMLTNKEVITMSAQILYFPSNGRTFQSTPEDSPLAFYQIEEIISQIQWATRGFEDNEELLSKHINNKLRVTFCVQRIQDIPLQHYEEALSLIEQAREEVWDFRYFIKDLQKSFADKILRDGDPWTASTKTKWRKKIAKQLPDRPDWRALALVIEGAKS